MTDEAKAADQAGLWFSARLPCWIAACSAPCFPGCFSAWWLVEIQGRRSPNRQQPDAPSRQSPHQKSCPVCGRPFQCRNKVEERWDECLWPSDRCRNNPQAAELRRGGFDFCLDLCTRSQPTPGILQSTKSHDLAEAICCPDLTQGQCGHARCECQTAFLIERSPPQSFFASAPDGRPHRSHRRPARLDPRRWQQASAMRSARLICWIWPMNPSA